MLDALQVMIFMFIVVICLIRIDIYREKRKKGL
jgi:hypothetical protein